VIGARWNRHPFFAPPALCLKLSERTGEAARFGDCTRIDSVAADRAAGPQLLGLSHWDTATDGLHPFARFSFDIQRVVFGEKRHQLTEAAEGHRFPVFNVLDNANDTIRVVFLSAIDTQDIILHVNTPFPICILPVEPVVYFMSAPARHHAARRDDSGHRTRSPQPAGK
jgi:hypothetical protein